MKSLYLLRHAKSSWKDAELSDIDRPLNKRGKEDAPKMGKRLAKLNVKPDFIISSPAKRTFRTACIIAPILGYTEKNIKMDMQLYGANIQQLLEIIQGELDQHQSIMLVGHNPGLTQLVEYLSSIDIENLPSCGLVEIRFKIDHWSEINEGLGELVLFEYPKK